MILVLVASLSCPLPLRILPERIKALLCESVVKPVITDPRQAERLVRDGAIGVYTINGFKLKEVEIKTTVERSVLWP